MTAPRLPAIDGLRGVAVMGIVAMNLPGFALPSGAYFNPAAGGPPAPSPTDAALWAAAFVLVDGKMRALFSMLFGAAIAILAARATAAGRDATRAHQARMAALGAIGLAHGVLLWPGDILLHYALVGCLAPPLLALPPRRLVAVAVALLAGQALVQAIVLAQDAQLTGGARAAFDAAVGVGPPPLVAREIALHRGPWLALAAAHARAMAAGVPFTLAFDGLETLAYMALGMAALSSGLFAGDWRGRDRARLAAATLGIALPLSAALAWGVAAGGFDTFATFAAATLGGVPLRPAIAVGYAAAAVPVLRRAGPRLRAAGRMTLSNYLLTSLALTALFDGWGLGRFGRWSRGEVYALAPLVWVAMLAWSAPWLARFRLGPAEWAWRSLAAGRPQPFRRTKAIARA